MSAPTFTQTESRPSTWSGLPSALDSLWSACLQDNGGRDVARALTANLVGLADREDRACLQDACDMLQRRAPCRAFVLLRDNGTERQPALLSAATRSHGSLRDIVLERIEICLHERELPRLPGLLRPLLLDDLPSHLFWARPWPADRTTFDALDELCTHTIVDSKRFGNPARDLQQLAERRARGQRLTDLSWLRLQPWRRALAEAFERFPWQTGTRVAGTLRHGRNARATTILLADWLSERLSASIVIEPDGREESVGPDHAKLQVGDVEILCELRDDVLVSHVTTQSHCHLPFSVGAKTLGDAELLANAIDGA
ncbi:MAG: glucose-6-phosphate dehydrogenase assembly protein OpcA [Planctomycetota bacterium]